MGPHGLVASYLSPGSAADAGQADRRAVRPLDGRREDRLRGRRGHERKRAAALPDHDLPFTDRVIATLVYLRFQLPHAALAVAVRVDRSTITRASEIRRCSRPAVRRPGEAGVRLRTLADVFAYAAARGVELRLDGTEVQVRRPRAGKPGRRAFVSGKKKQNTKRPPSSPTGRPHPVAARSARRCTTRPQCDRGHRRPVHPVPPVKPRSTPVPRPGQGVPRSGPGPAAQAEEGRHPRRNRSLRAERHKQSSERSASSTPTQSTSNGEPSSVTSDDAKLRRNLPAIAGLRPAAER